MWLVKIGVASKSRCGYKEVWLVKVDAASKSRCGYKVWPVKVGMATKRCG